VPNFTLSEKEIGMGAQNSTFGQICSFIAPRRLSDAPIYVKFDQEYQPRGLFLHAEFHSD